jgi:SAM-dependent methyltransferase
MRFQTSFVFTNREEKARYVWLKYQSILSGRMLDVGADQSELRRHLPPDAEYVSAGLEPGHDVRADLENPLPLASGNYDCVLCLDVLEHVDRIHALFDEICRVSRRYVIVSLPNPWANFLRNLRVGYYLSDRPTKYYFLPTEPPVDRHKWFFAASEAKRFLRERGKRNGFHVVQIDQMGLEGFSKAIFRRILPLFVHRSILPEDLLGDTVWAVLERDQDEGAGTATP